MAVWGPAVTVPKAPTGWVQRALPLVVGVCLTFTLTVVLTLEPMDMGVEGVEGGVVTEIVLLLEEMLPAAS